MDYIVQDLHNANPHGALRPATMGDVLDVMARSQRALLAIGLPETTVVAVNHSAEELFGETAETLVGRRATSLYRGADEVHASIALSALAAGALDSYSARCRLDTPNADLAWVSVRRFELQDVAVAIKMSVPLDHLLPLDGVEQEFTPPPLESRGHLVQFMTASGPKVFNSNSTPSAIATLDGLTFRQRQVVAALLQGDRTPAIAASLFVSNSTVRSHLSAIFQAFGVRSQTELLSLLRHRPTDRRSPT